MEDWDPYVILGISADATADEMRRQYRRLARMYHPDSNPEDARAAARFNMIQRAYDALTNPTTKTSAPDVDNDDDDDFGREEDDIDDFPDGISSALETDFPDDDNWVPETLSADAQWIDMPPSRKPKLRLIKVDVPLSQVIRPTATYLHIPDVGRVAVKIPAGADTGTVVPGVVRRHGNVERLAVELRVRAHPTYRRRGLDLVTRYRVSAKTAWNGHTTTIDTPAGRITLSIPKRSRWGDVIRVPCKGIMGEGAWGNLFVELSKHNA